MFYSFLSSLVLAYHLFFFLKPKRRILLIQWALELPFSLLRWLTIPSCYHVSKRIIDTVTKATLSRCMYLGMVTIIVRGIAEIQNLCRNSVAQTTCKCMSVKSAACLLSHVNEKVEFSDLLCACTILASSPDPTK